jgi:hypothetical protein
MLLMCLTILTCRAALRAWQVYMMTARTEDWLRISEAEHRKRLAWAELIGDRGGTISKQITGWLVR